MQQIRDQWPGLHPAAKKKVTQNGAEADPHHAVQTVYEFYERMRPSRTPALNVIPYSVYCVLAQQRCGVPQQNGLVRTLSPSAEASSALSSNELLNPALSPGFSGSSAVSSSAPTTTNDDNALAETPYGSDTHVKDPLGAF